MCRRPKHNWPVVSRCDGSPLRLRVRNVQREHFEYEIRSIPCFASQNDRAEPTLFQFIFIYQQRGYGAMAHNASGNARRFATIVFLLPISSSQNVVLAVLVAVG